MAQVQIEIPHDAIAQFCKQWKVAEFALFGSVLTPDFRPDSDIDVLITHESDTHWTLFDHVHMIETLEKIFGRKVDLLTRSGIERSDNYLRKEAILQSAQVIHAA